MQTLLKARGICIDNHLVLFADTKGAKNFT